MPKKVEYTFKRFVRDAKDFADYPHNGERDALAINHCALNVSAQTGALAFIVLNAIQFDKLGQQGRRLSRERIELVESDIGELLFWLARLADESGTSLEDCALDFALSNEEALRNAAIIHGDKKAQTILDRRRRRK